MSGEKPVELPSQSGTGSGFQYTQALASQLIRYLGFEDAERTCRQNHWDGVLAAIKAQRRDSGAP